MKRTDLQPGTEYAYNTSKYGSPKKVRVIDTEAVHRITSGYGYSGSSENKDGLRVVMVGSNDNFGGWSNGVHYITGEKYAGAIADPTAYSSKRIMEQYDGTDENDEQILRILPRYITMTWADYEDEKAADALALDERIQARKDRHIEGHAVFAKLPERYREFIKYTEHPDGSGGWSISEYKVEDLAKLLIEESA